jgi:hypothetical protein
MSPFSFLNPALLWGLAAAAAPIILHLLNRQRFRVVAWGAMMFLKHSLAKARRRLRFQHLLLMLVRILILSLFALALARPLVRTAFTAIIGHTRTDLVLVLDCSFSTAYLPGASSDFDNVKRTAASLIDTLQRGDTVSIFLAGKTARPLTADPSFELEQMKRSLEELKPDPAPADFLRAMEEVNRWLPKLRSPNREVYLITDAAACGWQTGNLAAWDRLGAALKAAKPPPAVRVLTVAGADRANTAVISLDVQPHVVAANQPARIAARVANYSREPREVVASLSVDGAQKATKDLHLAPAEIAPVDFTLQFPDAGPHRVMLDIGPDALTLDNRRYLALDAVEKLPVLIADGLPSANPFRSASGFLGVALQPSDDAVLKPTVTDARALASADLRPYCAVLLANVAQVDEATARKLERFVAGGRGLLIAPGNLADAANYAATLYQEGRYLLPARLATIHHAPPATPGRVAANATWRTELADLVRVQVRSWWRLESGPTSATLARLANGDPLIVSRRLGDGRIIQMALPLDATWSDLPVHPIFVPLVHELVYELALSSQASRNLLVGEPSPEAAFTTAEPGAASQNGRALAVNLDPAESDLAPLPAEQQAQIAQRLGATFAADWRNLPARIGEERFGRQFWRPLVIAALLLALLEILLTSIWSARRAPTEQALPQLVLNR